MIEHPAKATWTPFPVASSFELPVTRLVTSLPEVDKFTFDQCVTGQLSRKPTTLLLLLLRMPETKGDLQTLGNAGRCNCASSHQAATGRDEQGRFKTTVLKTYTSRLNEAIAAGIHGHADRIASARETVSQLPEDLMSFHVTEIRRTDAEVVQPDYHRDLQVSGARWQ